MTVIQLLNDYISERDSDSARRSYKSIINSYITWRKISLEQLIENGLKEKLFLEKYLTDPALKIVEGTRKIHISVVKGFMIFCGIEFKRYSRKKRPFYYEDDEVMQDFLTLTGTKEITKRGANRHLYMYCEFRGKTPTELIEESKIISKPKLRVHLKEFYDNMTIETKKAVLSRIMRFYRIMGDVHIDLPNIRSQKKLGLMLGEKPLVDKKVIKELLAVADLRDSMIVMSSFESGLNPVDLVMFNYGDLKTGLNLDNPLEIKQVAVIPRIRSKTNYQYLACFGIQSLQLISKWLILVKNNLKDWNKELTDDFPIFCQKHAPHQRLNNYSIAGILKTVSKYAGYDEPFLSSDFRNSWNTRVTNSKTIPHFMKEIFMGHSGGIERHYNNTSLEDFRKAYLEAWEYVFDLSFDDEKVKNLEDELMEIKSTLKLILPIVKGSLVMSYISDDIEIKQGFSREYLEKVIDEIGERETVNELVKKLEDEKETVKDNLKKLDDEYKEKLPEE